MPQAFWNGQVIATADAADVEIMENNVYFPAAALDRAFFRDSAHHTTCPWKGQASYYDVVVDGKVNDNAAWYYPTPYAAARQIAGHVAFWRGVEVTG